MQNEGRPQQKNCYRACDETGGLALKEWRKMWRSTCFSAFSDLWVPNEYPLKSWSNIKQGIGEKKLEGENICDPLEMVVEEKGGSNRCSVTELGRRAGDLIWKIRGRGEDLQLACLLPLPDPFHLELKTNTCYTVNYNFVVPVKIFMNLPRYGFS